MMKKISPFAPKIIKHFNIIKGINVSSTHCGLKKNQKDDLVLITFKKSCKILGFFTSSKTPGEPIKWNRGIIKHRKVSAILINSGIANVNTGADGKKAIDEIVRYLSIKLKINHKEIYIASTGVIGEKLDKNKIINSLPKLIRSQSNNRDSWISAAKAITTTDTFSKIYSKKINIEDQNLIINGIAKGSGMIEPNMATMLAFLFTNFDSEKMIMKKLIQPLIEESFNSITVDGEMSTSDMVLIVYGIKENNNKRILNHIKFNKFQENLLDAMISLSKLIISDGEGISKFITIKVKNADNYKNAKKIAKSIANSLLFKTAMAGNDFNWGRILMAIGKVQIEIIQKKISIKFGNFEIIKNGKVLEYSESKVKNYIKKGIINLEIKLGMGNEYCRVWTCDITKEYVSINSDYRS